MGFYIIYHHANINNKASVFESHKSENSATLFEGGYIETVVNETDFTETQEKINDLKDKITCLHDIQQYELDELYSNNTHLSDEGFEQAEKDIIQKYEPITQDLTKKLFNEEIKDVKSSAGQLAEDIMDIIKAYFKLSMETDASKELHHKFYNDFLSLMKHNVIPSNIEAVLNITETLANSCNKLTHGANTDRSDLLAFLSNSINEHGKHSALHKIIMTMIMIIQKYHEDVPFGILTWNRFIRFKDIHGNIDSSESLQKLKKMELVLVSSMIGLTHTSEDKFIGFTENAEDEEKENTKMPATPSIS